MIRTFQGSQEEHKLGMHEFSLLGKPWARKHVADSERLFIDILVRLRTLKSKTLFNVLCVRPL